jgi:uncharacterized membrane protein
MAVKRISRLAPLARNLRRNFLAGLVIVTPIAATILIMKWLFDAIDGILEPVVELIFGRPVAGIGFAAIVILIYLAGLVAANVMGRRVIQFGESLVVRVPMAREIYNTIKQVVNSLMLSQKGGFREVVLVEFPRPGMQTVGFVTNRVVDGSGRELLNVFIPTAPNPTSGFFQIIPPENTSRTNLSVEEGMKLVVSAGMVSPPVIETRTGED